MLLDCCNLEKYFNRSFLKLVLICSSLFIKFDATLVFCLNEHVFCLQSLEGFEILSALASVADFRRFVRS